MVGDIKQSIYKFRGAEPSLFSTLRREFPDISEADGSDTATIFMSNNFRCDQSVINFTNLICSTIFKQIGGCVDYTRGDDLVFSKKPESDLGEKVRVSVISILADDLQNVFLPDHVPDRVTCRVRAFLPFFLSS